ncbi:MAG: hypothetical protein JWM61_3173, partial [Micrococcaceae bacterium]|nr:hypothetical protein [Micrococcaceae bacterium]
MRTCMQRGLFGVLLAGGVVVLGAGAATAADLPTPSTAGAESDLGVIITAPLQLGTTSGSIIEATAGSLNVSVNLGTDLDVDPGNGDSGLLEGSAAGALLDGGLLNGNVVSPEVVAPVNVSGNSVSVIGDSSSTGTPGSTGSTGGTAPVPAPVPVSVPGDGALLDGGLLNGNVVSPEVVAPVNVSG